MRGYSEKAGLQLKYFRDSFQINGRDQTLKGKAKVYNVSTLSSYDFKVHFFKVVGFGHKPKLNSAI